MTDATAVGPVGAGSTALRRAGGVSWSVLGIIALAVVVAAGFCALSGILVPLVVAVLLGIVLEPMVALLRRWRVPAALSVLLTLLATVAVGAGTVIMVLRGFLSQWPEIYRQAFAGWDALLSWARSLDLGTDGLERARVALEGHAAGLAEGAVGLVAGTIYGAVTLFMGVFFAVYFLFFALRDAARFPAWLSHTVGFDPVLVGRVVELSRESVRGYFKGTAVTALVTAPIFMVPLVLLGIPLAVPIFILYFLLSFVPFLGAWITGAFAILIALGSGGPSAALIIGITFMISNGAVQSAVNSWSLGSSLRLHPVAVILATMIGGSVAGLLGMVIGAPALAVCVKSIAAIREIRTAHAGPPPLAPPSAAPPAPARGRADDDHPGG